MSIPIPSLQTIDAFSLELWQVVKPTLVDLFKEQPVTRSKRSKWHAELQGELMEISAIRRWLNSSIGQEANHLSNIRVVQTFLTVTYYINAHEEDAACTLLLRIQKCVNKDQFGLAGVHNYQHNFLEELAHESDSTDSDSDRDEIKVTESISNSNGLQKNHPRLLEGLSPDRKRLKRTQATPSTIATSVEFESFNALPVTARNRAHWNRLFQDSRFWQPTCNDWTNDLKAAFQDRKNRNLSNNKSQAHYEKLVEVLREIRQVSETIYKQERWRQVVKLTGLANAILDWSNPVALVLWKAPFMTRLIRKHRIHETLALVLLNWIPGAVMHSWTSTPRKITSKCNANRIRDGIHLYRIIESNAGTMIPHEAYPSSIFFLLNAANFDLAVTQWLGFALASLNFDITCLSTPQKVLNLFNSIKRHIFQFGPSKLENIKSPIFRAIVRRTVEFNKTKEMAPERFLATRQGINSICTLCANLRPEQKCIQVIPVEVKTLGDEYLGCGVTKAPKSYQMQPIPTPHSKPGKHEIKPIHHASTLNLKRISADQAVIDRCGMQLFKIVDKKNPEEMLDFWLYEAFTEEVLDKLISHHRQLRNVKSLKRGKQFNSYSLGNMYGRGDRDAQGGAPGDAFTSYAGMNALSVPDIDALFNDAEDSMILSEVARVLKFQIVKALEQDSAFSDRLGTSGSNTFLCSGYTSPLHRDNDAGTGLCAQYDLRGLDEYDEYSFIHADYGIYMVAHRNSLWSFDGKRTHGTMLPSTVPLRSGYSGRQKIVARRQGQPEGGPDGPPRVSNGIHKTQPKANKVAAERYQTVRNHCDDMRNYWKELAI